MDDKQKTAAEAALKALKAWWLNTDPAKEQPLLDGLVAAVEGLQRSWEE
ncbi:MAG TPA: hypothetical protein VM755_19805 [Stellaceae bacterium]|nr:hypothetical protein [Stellaceae bacterium]